MMLLGEAAARQQMAELRKLALLMGEELPKRE